MAGWGPGCRLWTPDFCILRITLLPGGILHITSVSQADVGTYRCVAHNVANIRHSQDAQLSLSSKQVPGESEWALGRKVGGSWCCWEWVWLMWLYVVQILCKDRHSEHLLYIKHCAGYGRTAVSRLNRLSPSRASQSSQPSREGRAVGTQHRDL